MKKRQKVLLGIGLSIILIGLFLKNFIFIYKVGEEIVLTGVVVLNENECCDMAQSLYIKEGLRRIRIEYHDGGIAPTCKNPEAFDMGDSLQEGDRVEVYGISVEGFNRLTICPSEDYYIKKL